MTKRATTSLEISSLYSASNVLNGPLNLRPRRRVDRTSGTEIAVRTPNIYRGRRVYELWRIKATKQSTWLGCKSALSCEKLCKRGRHIKHCHWVEHSTFVCALLCQPLHLLSIRQVHGADPRRLMLLTASRRAAVEMTRRVERETVLSILIGELGVCGRC